MPTTSQGEAVQNAASGPAPTQAGSAAQATSANRTTARAEKAAGRAGGNTSAVGRILEQVADANAKIDQYIPSELIEPVAEVLIALRRLAKGPYEGES